MVLESGDITQEGIDRLRAHLGVFNCPRQYCVCLYNEQATQDAIRPVAVAQGLLPHSPYNPNRRAAPAKPSIAPSRTRSSTQ
jgi:hypothetical protein